MLKALKSLLSVVFASLVLILAGCADNSSFTPPAVTVTPPAGESDDEGASEDEPADDTQEPAGESVRIVGSLGLIQNADVTVTQADGTALPDTTGTLDASGVISFTHDGSYDGPILITISGNDAATYFDEASGTNLPMPTGTTLRAFAPSLLPEVGVTILTELAAQQVDNIEGAISADAITAVNNSVRDSLAPELSDILSAPALVSEANFTAQSLANDDAGIYALRLAALANIAAANDSPALSILDQLSADLADGDIDAVGIDGALTDLSYTAEDFVSVFSSAIQLAASTLADSDLVTRATDLTVSVSDNLIEVVVNAGVGLPTSVTDLIDNDVAPVTDTDDSDISDGVSDVVDGIDGATGDFDLTVTGQIITFGIGTDFSVTIQGIAAPSPDDTAEITQVIEDTLEGITGVTNLQVTVINNSAERITFEASFTAQQSGVEVMMNLTYDYTPSSGSATSDDTSGASGDTTEVDFSSLGQICFFGGEPTPATVPESIRANTWVLTFTAAQAGAPYNEGDTRTFLFSSSGGLFIDDVQVASMPALCNGNEREAIWKDVGNNVLYSLSDLVSGFNEVNVNSAADGSFLGQFVE